MRAVLSFEPLTKRRPSGRIKKSRLRKPGLFFGRHIISIIMRIIIILIIIITLSRRGRKHKAKALSEVSQGLAAGYLG